MDKTSLGLAAAISALVVAPVASANTATQSALPKAQSFAELLEPIANAGERLRLADAEEAAAPRLIQVQNVAHHHHHHAHVVVQPRHHHHFRRVWRRRYRPHHHHHHSQ